MILCAFLSSLFSPFHHSDSRNDRPDPPGNEAREEHLEDATANASGLLACLLSPSTSEACAEARQKEKVDEKNRQGLRFGELWDRGFVKSTHSFV